MSDRKVPQTLGIQLSSERRSRTRLPMGTFYATICYILTTDVTEIVVVLAAEFFREILFNYF